MSSPSQAARDFYCTFSNSSSAGGLVSGKGKEDRKLFIHELLCEFKNHKKGAQKFNEKICRERLIALISMTVSFIDALRRAFDKLYRGDEPDQSWIDFISVPHKDKATYHHADSLAREMGQDETSMFKDEYIFEWEV